MKVGFFIGALKKEIGGSYTFLESLLRSFDSVETTHEIIVFYYGDHKPSGFSNQISFVSLSSGRKLEWIVQKGVSFLSSKRTSTLQLAADYFRIELLWFFSTDFVPVDTPYICSVLDLEYRAHPFFPEVGTIDRWLAIDNLFTPMIQRAAYIMSGTATGKEQIVNYFKADGRRVRVIPFPVAPFAIEQKSPPSLHTQKKSEQKPYLFYPAQFWPHKNHIVLLHALKLIRDKYGLDFDLVLCGSDKGNLSYIKRKCQEFGLESHVRFLGFVSREELYELYLYAFALVFPSMFGPDNLPPLEAFAIGCPVVAARLTGAEDQLRDNVLYFDPLCEEEIATAVLQLRQNPDLRAHLIEKGKARAANWTATDYLREIITIFDEFEKYRRCWSRSEKFVLN